jgi:uncharacterized protein HemX
MRGVGIIIAIAIVVVLGAAAFWQRNRAEFARTGPDTATRLQDAEQQNASAISALQKQVQDMQKQLGGSGQPGSDSQIADLKNQLSAEQSERKLLSDQVGSLSARVDSLVKANAAENPPAQHPTRRRRR